MVRSSQEQDGKPPTISILYVDQYIVVINKPHGLRSVPGNKVAVPRLSTTARKTKTDGGTTASKIGGGTTDRGTTATTASETAATASANDSLLTTRSEPAAIPIPTTTRTLKKRPREQTEASEEDPEASASSAAAVSILGGNSGSGVERRLTAQQAWVAAIESFRQVGSSPLLSSQIPDHEEDCCMNNSNSHRNDKNNEKGIVNDDNDCGDTTRVKVKVESKARHWISCIADSHPNQLPSVPRKIHPFLRYCRRNQYKWRRKQQEQQQQQQQQRQHKSSQNLTTDPVNTDEQLQRHSSQQRNDSGVIENCKFVGGGGDDDDESTTEEEMIAREVHSILSTKQRKLMNLPVQTSPEESAYGQVQQYFSTCRTAAPSTAPPPLHSPHPSTLYVVHRLDCETSGVMVFARTQQAASQLGRYWRNEVVTSFKGGGYLGPDVLPVKERAVQKSYIALVESWPPLTDNGETSGVIDVPLSPHPTERLKWTVDYDNGKPSRTVWKISDTTIKISDNTINGMSPIQLELQPISGRTHQLRIHCAYMNGKGIIGDSLYSVGCNDLSSPSTKEDKSTPLRLYLHARKLSFPHPSTGKRLVFSCDPTVW
mmetsp:Transcript_17137/g.41571  ORF Transcript_17137/g.41571 Transcript_17137/m.41571 type:complete len:598 (+) Transcript_17137:185-1978(+)